VPFLEEAKDRELPNSRTVVEVGLDEIPLTSSVNSEELHSSMMKVNAFHVIFDLNRVLITTCFNKGSCIIILHPRLKEFLEKCLLQF
jgi:hypothetical protein